MKPVEAEAWKSMVLDEVLSALAASPGLEAALVYKGARILNLRLSGGRQSLDIDSNLRAAFVERYPNRIDQRIFLEWEMTRTIREHFEGQSPVRFELTKLSVTDYPPRSHPMGWDAFKVRMNVNDLTREVRGLPAIEVDVSAPEELLESSVSTIRVGGHEVCAYTLERIAGEKLRAFLSSLPAYRAKLKKPGEAVRAKDLYDLARIHQAHDLGEEGFWLVVGREFHVACRSRYIDCTGLASFQEQWEVTRKTYSAATIPDDIPFEEAETCLIAVVGFFERHGVVPFSFPLPASVRSSVT